MKMMGDAFIISLAVQLIIDGNLIKINREKVRTLAIQSMMGKSIVGCVSFKLLYTVEAPAPVIITIQTNSNFCNQKLLLIKILNQVKGFWRDEPSFDLLIKHLPSRKLTKMEWWPKKMNQFLLHVDITVDDFAYPVILTHHMHPCKIFSDDNTR